MRKKYVKYSKKVSDFIISKMEDEGLLVEQVCKKYPEDTPTSKNVYRWSATKPEFAAKLNQAYTVWLMAKLYELETVSSNSLEALYPNLSETDARDTRRARMDALKFTLGKMAPVLSKRFAVKQEIEHTGTVNAPSIIIQSYALPEPIKDVKDVGLLKIEEKTL